MQTHGADNASMTRCRFFHRMWKTLLTRGMIFSMLASTHSVLAQSTSKDIPNPIGVKSFSCLIKALSEAAITIVVPIAIVAIIFAGLKFIIAGAKGDEGGIKQARTMLFWVVIGTAVVVGSFVLAEVGIKFLQPTTSPGALVC